jgi:hypothetical protein
MAEEIFSFGESVIEAVEESRRRLRKELCLLGMRTDKSQDEGLKSDEVLGLLDTMKKDEENERHKLALIRQKLR